MEEWIDNMVHLHNAALLRVKKNDILKFAGKLIELDKTILSEITQTQKDKHGMYSLVSGY